MTTKHVNDVQSAVCEWLSLLRLSEYSSLLERQGYTHMDSITDITWEDLEDIGITKLGRDFIVLSFHNYIDLICVSTVWCFPCFLISMKHCMTLPCKTVTC